MRGHNIGIYGSWEKYPRIILKYSSYMEIDSELLLKGYCTTFQHALKSLEITGIVSP